MIEYDWGYAEPDGFGEWTLVHKDAGSATRATVEAAAEALLTQQRHSVHFRTRWLERAEQAVRDLEAVCVDAR